VNEISLKEINILLNDEQKTQEEAIVLKNETIGRIISGKNYTNNEQD